MNDLPAADLGFADNGVLHFAFGKHSRLLPEWRAAFGKPGESNWSAVRRAARQLGAAGVFLADDSYRLLYMDGGKLRQKSWPKAKPIYGDDGRPIGRP